MKSTFEVHRFFVFANNSVACVLVSSHQTKEHAEKTRDELNAAVQELGKSKMVRMIGAGQAQDVGTTVYQFLRWIAVKQITHDVVEVPVESLLEQTDSKIILPH